MYHVEGLTQNEIAKKLGVGRVTVVRNLNEALRRREIKVWIEDNTAECVELERELKSAFGFAEAVVVPEPSSPAKVAKSIGFAAGMHVSEALSSGMSVGVGWGSTLYESLQTLAPPELENIEVISMLGGIVQARRQNPSEFAWQFAQIAGADCYLLAAPAIVDSPETKKALIERCGLSDVLSRAERLDMALVSVGSMATGSTTFRFGFVSNDERLDLIRLGAVGDLMFNFFDIKGRIIDHPINHRVMSIPIEQLRRVPRRIIASGGGDKIDSLVGAFKLIDCTELITNEATARKLLAKKA